MNGFINMLLSSLIACHPLLAKTTNDVAPGAPGNDAHWPTAAKDGFGTANTIASKVWFTLSDGVLSEVFYPTLDVPNVQMLQLIVVGANVETESQDTIHRTEVLDPRALTFRQINTARSGYYTTTKTYVTDPERNTVLIDIQFDSSVAARVYVYYDPSLTNSGMHDSAWTEGNALVAIDGNKASALIASSGFASRDGAIRAPGGLPGPTNELEVSNGYLGTSDGLTELRKNWNRSSFTPYARADNGNVVQVAELKGLQRSGSKSNNKTGAVGPVKLHWTLALGFGANTVEALKNSRASLARGFARVRREYESGWEKYTGRLPQVGLRYQRQFNMSAMVLKGLEDKTYRGAIIASPSIPWGGGPNANEATISGYHAVWCRDLYQVATALYSVGDKAAANRALDYLFNVQQLSDGSFPQNTWVDGRPIGGGLQLDEVGLPIVLAYQLGRVDRDTWLKHIKTAADFITRNGPPSGQDRWEEKPGYSPATIAAEIAGLVCAARVARLNVDKESEAVYLKTADNWVANIDRWTATTNGPHGDGHYYLRITEKGTPNEETRIEINSGGGSYDQRAIVDAGFLELVRLGIKRPDDRLISKSLAVVDKILKVETPLGPGWYRYNHDAYGERLDGKPYDGRSGVGRLWTLLIGERGEFELASGNKSEARRLLDTMTDFANDGLMIPEQVWDRSGPSPLKFGTSTGSATPLAWSMAQFIRLAVNLQKNRNLDTPSVVALRYAKRRFETR
jgi:glucoamylase